MTHHAHTIAQVAEVFDWAAASAVLATFTRKARRWWRYPEGLIMGLLFIAFVTGSSTLALHILFGFDTEDDTAFAWLQASMFWLTFVLFVCVLIVMWRKLNRRS